MSAQDEARSRIGGNAPTLSDVSRCYRLLLDREVESVAVAGQQIAASPTVGDLFERIWLSQEALHCRIGEALGQVPRLLQRSQIEFQATPEQRARIWDETIAAWARRGFGSYHQWLRRNEPRFDGRSARWSVEHALDGAEPEVSELMELCRRHGRLVGARDAVAVFGSQAFRLGAALAPSVDRYHHFEVIPDELERGAGALAARGHANAHGAMVSALRDQQGRFDLFYAVSALQYAPPPMIADLLGLALTALKPGGMLVCQLACQLHDYRFDPSTYLAGLQQKSAGEIHAFAQREVLTILDRNDAAILEIVPDGRVGPLGISFTFVARRRE